jgi:hypothetical protein
MIYLIAYSINEKLYDYSDLKEQIKSLGEFQHPMDDVWFVSSKHLDEEYEAAKLRRLLHSERDMIFMTAISRQSVQGWMPKAFWQWLEFVDK